MLHCSLKKTHEQWSMLHCSWVFQLKKQQIAASCNPVAVPQLTGGPTSRILLLEYYQTGELLWLLQTQKQPRNQTPSSRPRGMNYEKTITLLDVNKNLNVLRRERKHCLFWYCFPLFFTPWVFYILVPWFLLLTIQSFNFILIYLNLKLKKCSAPFFWWDLQAHLNGKGGFHANLFFFF